jgi:hypothetical protein
VANASPAASLGGVTAGTLSGHYGEAISLTGTYSLVPIRNTRGTLLAAWPALVLADGTTVLLGSIWEERRDGRSPEERPEYVARPIRATGTLLASPPAEEGSQNLAMPTLHPVTELRLIETSEQ